MKKAIASVLKSAVTAAAVIAGIRYFNDKMLEHWESDDLYQMRKIEPYPEEEEKKADEEN